MSANSGHSRTHGSKLGVKSVLSVKHDGIAPEIATDSPRLLLSPSKVSGSVLVHVAKYLNSSNRQSGHDERNPINDNHLMCLFPGRAV